MAEVITYLVYSAIVSGFFLYILTKKNCKYWDYFAEIDTG